MVYIGGRRLGHLCGFTDGGEETVCPQSVLRKADHLTRGARANDRYYTHAGYLRE